MACPAGVDVPGIHVDIVKADAKRTIGDFRIGKYGRVISGSEASTAQAKGAVALGRDGKLNAVHVRQCGLRMAMQVEEKELRAGVLQLRAGHRSRDAESL